MDLNRERMGMIPTHEDLFACLYMCVEDRWMVDDAQRQEERDGERMMMMMMT